MASIISYMGNYLVNTIANFLDYDQVPMNVLPAFGARQWKERVNLDIKEPPLPEGIQKIWDSPCPWWPGKLVKETHMLCLVPYSLSFDELHNLLNTSSGNMSSQHQPDKNTKEGYWIIMTKKNIPQVTCLLRKRQEKLLLEKGYRFPEPIETAGSILAAKYLGNYALYPTRSEATQVRGENTSHDVTIGSDPHIYFTSYGSNWDINKGVAGVICLEGSQKMYESHSETDKA